jgi:osmotically-inducible protein OsmY
MKIDKDTKLQHNVLAELEWDPSVEASHIGVAAQDGVVTLTGSVDSYADKRIAERVAQRVYGVKAVANDVDVKVPGSLTRTDTDIASAALSALKWHARVPDDRIKLTVRNGWITLEGEVEWWYQKDAAEHAIRNVRGINGIVNDIKVKARVKPTEVKDKIEAAFKRNAEIDARRVNVEAHDGKVILHGSVRSWMEREEAQHAAWAAPGVTTVENHITVTP